MSKSWELAIEVLVGAAVAAYTGNALNQKANRIAQAIERGDQSLSVIAQRRCAQ